MLIFFIGITAQAQEKSKTLTITGTVLDATQTGIPGATIQNVNSKIMAQTDLNGNYSIAAKKGDTLKFSFIGMITQTVKVDKKTNINVTLQDEVQSLSEVVVEGYRTVSKHPGNSYKNKVKEKALKGQVPGLVISPAKDYHHVPNRISTAEMDDNEDYAKWIENPFESPKNEALSTFSIDVDNASYTNIRRFLNAGAKVPEDAVRVEEMLNFFKYNYDQPQGKDPIAITTEYSDCPWNSNHKLLRIGLKGREIKEANLPASNMVFLIDVSGSMNYYNKLPLLKESFKVLLEKLRPIDKVSIVVYAGAAGVVLEPTSGNEKEKIAAALDRLTAGGSTAGGAGIELAYKLASEHFIKGGNNRVILATDGDFNVGSSSNSDMEKLIEEKRKSGVFLTVLGFGMGNYKDSKMEILANKGNGNYAYIDTMQEANRFLGKEFSGSMFTLAKDVKVQVEFNPVFVQNYRLIGYENRKLRAEDFNNDAIDAGEMGSGHTVTALYEIIPNGVNSKFSGSIDELKYSEPKKANLQFPNDLATVKFRYKEPDGEKSKLFSKVIGKNSRAMTAASADMKFATAVAWFGLKLRNSKYIDNDNLEQIRALAQSGLSNDDDGYRREFIRLTQTPVLLSAK